MTLKKLSEPTKNLAAKMQGVWWLLSREDHTKDGQRRVDPILGSDPLAILAYAKDRFSAQFMKRDRTDVQAVQAPQAGQNNTAAMGGYDAYFGSYKVDERTGQVAHTLMGSIIASNVGLTVSRDLRVDGDTLIIQLETTSTGGEPIIRTLTWKRIG
ncbi:MAG TPA: lipocalin-like domain-containing protein [Mucilaginibacter sp.]|nr:lipocalin-like domain-containing protein [Mucilaginibacter sp.]